MKSKWYDDWLIEKSNKGGWRVTMPHLVDTPSKIVFRKVSDARVEWLIDVLMCALHEISERDKADKKK